MQAVANAPIKTKRELAKRLEVNRRTVGIWAKLGDFPGGMSGPWDLELCSAWKRARQKAAADDKAEGKPARVPVADGTDPASLDVDTRYRWAKAQLAELELRKRQAELVELHLVRAMQVDRTKDLRKALGGLGRKLATRLEGANERKIQTLIDDKVAQILADFCRRAGLDELTEDED